MKELKTKEELADFLDRHAFTLKETQEAIHRIYALARGYYYNLAIPREKIAQECAGASSVKTGAFAVDMKEAEPVANLYIIRGGEVAIVDLFDDNAIAAITAKDAKEEPPY